MGLFMYIFDIRKYVVVKAVYAYCVLHKANNNVRLPHFYDFCLTWAVGERKH